MQAPASLGVIGAVVGVVLLGLVLATVSVYSLLATPLVLLGLIVFLVWRGRQRAKPTLSERQENRVPTTEEAAADPVGDSGVRDAARARSGSRSA
jgi:hypothetical protein